MTETNTFVNDTNKEDSLDVLNILFNILSKQTSNCVSARSLKRSRRNSAQGSYSYGQCRLVLVHLLLTLFVDMAKITLDTRSTLKSLHKGMFLLSFTICGRVRLGLQLYSHTSGGLVGKSMYYDLGGCIKNEITLQFLQYSRSLIACQ